MDYLPTLALHFPSGVTNVYRIRERSVEFSTQNGAWRALDADDMQLHYLLKTEVSKWLLMHKVEMNPHVREPKVA